MTVAIWCVSVSRFSLVDGWKILRKRHVLHSSHCFIRQEVTCSEAGSVSCLSWPQAETATLEMVGLPSLKRVSLSTSF